LRGVPSGRLRINAPLPAIDLVIQPMVVPFLKKHPQIELEIIAETSFVDIVAAGFDAGVRYGEHLAQDMIALSLGPPERYAVVASADYVARHGRPKKPEVLLAHSCLRTVFASGALPDWEFEKDGRIVKVSPKGVLVGNNLRLMLQAVREGAGYWAIFEGYVRDDVRAGTLVSVLEDWLPPFPGPFLYYPSRRQPPPALSAFISFVNEWKAQKKRATRRK
jgi:DNA-binding transcriptional LysR family regulator